MKRTDARHPNNDCKVWSQLERWQMECIEQIKRDTGRTESDIVRNLLKKPLGEYLVRRNEIMKKVADEIGEMTNLFINV